MSIDPATQKLNLKPLSSNVNISNIVGGSNQINDQTSQKDNIINSVSEILKQSKYLGLPTSLDYSHLDEEFIKEAIENSLVKNTDNSFDVNIKEIILNLSKYESERTELEIQQDKIIHSQKELYESFLLSDNSEAQKIKKFINEKIGKKIKDNVSKLNSARHLEQYESLVINNEDKVKSIKSDLFQKYDYIKSNNLDEIKRNLELEILFSKEKISQKIYSIHEYSKLFRIYKENCGINLYNYFKNNYITKNYIQYIEINLRNVIERLVKNENYKVNCWVCKLENIFINDEIYKIRLTNFNDKNSIDINIFKNQIKNNYMKYFARKLGLDYSNIIKIIIDDTEFIKLFNILLLNLQVYYFIRGHFDGFTNILKKSFFIDVVIRNIIKIYNLMNSKFKKKNINFNFRNNYNQSNDTIHKIYDSKKIIENVLNSIIKCNFINYIWENSRNENSIKNICNNLYLNYPNKDSIGGYELIRISIPDKILDIFYASKILNSYFRKIYIYEFQDSKILFGGERVSYSLAQNLNQININNYNHILFFLNKFLESEKKFKKDIYFIVANVSHYFNFLPRNNLTSDISKNFNEPNFKINETDEGMIFFLNLIIEGILSKDIKYFHEEISLKLNNIKNKIDF
jgi:hypothetical protein